MSVFSQIYPANDTLVVNSTFTLNSHPYTPFVLWGAVVAIAVLLFILSFWFPLRDQGGRVSSQRVAFSLLAMLTCGITAWLSLAISVPTSVAESLFDLTNGTQMVVVQSFTVYSQLEIVGLFVIFSLISLANFIYTLMQPEILKSEPDEFKGQNENKVKAEEK